MPTEPWFEVTINPTSGNAPVEMGFTEFMQRFHSIKYLDHFARNAKVGETADYYMFATNYHVVARRLEDVS